MNLYNNLKKLADIAKKYNVTIVGAKQIPPSEDMTYSECFANIKDPDFIIVDCGG